MKYKYKYVNKLAGLKMDEIDKMLMKKTIFAHCINYEED